MKDQDRHFYKGPHVQDKTSKESTVPSTSTAAGEENPPPNTAIPNNGTGQSTGNQ